jgi:hypothetical protein
VSNNTGFDHEVFNEVEKNEEEPEVDQENNWCGQGRIEFWNSRSYEE